MVKTQKYLQVSVDYTKTRCYTVFITQGGAEMKTQKINSHLTNLNLDDDDRKLIQMTLLFKKLNLEQQDYIAAMADGMKVSNELLEKSTINS